MNFGIVDVKRLVKNIGFVMAVFQAKQYKPHKILPP
jgi:hypothetical protein